MKAFQRVHHRRDKPVVQHEHRPVLSLKCRLGSISPSRPRFIPVSRHVIPGDDGVAMLSEVFDCLRAQEMRTQCSFPVRSKKLARVRERAEEFLGFSYFPPNPLESAAETQGIAVAQSVISDPVALGTGTLGETPGRRVLQPLAHDEERGAYVAAFEEIEKPVRSSRPWAVIEGIG